MNLELFDAALIGVLVSPLVLSGWIALVHYLQSQMEHCSLGRLDVRRPPKPHSTEPPRFLNGFVREPRPIKPFGRTGRIAMPEPEQPSTIEAIGTHL